MSTILNNFIISALPNGKEHDASHLTNSGSTYKCAITEQGIKEHNAHNLRQGVLIGTGIAAVSLPVIIGGGIGIVAGGEAIGLGALEQVIFGGAAGAASAKAMDKPVKGYLRDDKHETLSLIDMVGDVITWRRRWWDQPGYDVKVRWVGADEYGNRTTFTAWHNPEHLVALKKA